MNAKNILWLPFAIVADVVTLGNLGDRSFTQQVFDRDREESAIKALIRGGGNEGRPAN